MSSKDIHFDAAGNDPQAIEALQQLLRLGAASLGEAQSEEVTRVTEELFEALKIDIRPLAWFVYIAGQITGVFAATLETVTANGDDGDPISGALDAIRTLEIVMEREIRVDKPAE